MISRRQFLRACMYVAPAALVAPKAISYFLPPRINVATSEEMNWVSYGASDELVANLYDSSPIINLIIKRMQEAERSMADGIASMCYHTSPQEWGGAATELSKRGALYAHAGAECAQLRHYQMMGVPVVLDPALKDGQFEFRRVS